MNPPTKTRDPATIRAFFREVLENYSKEAAQDCSPSIQEKAIEWLYTQHILAQDAEIEQHRETAKIVEALKERNFARTEWSRAAHAIFELQAKLTAAQAFEPKTIQRYAFMCAAGCWDMFLAENGSYVLHSDHLGQLAHVDTALNLERAGREAAEAEIVALREALTDIAERFEKWADCDPVGDMEDGCGVNLAQVEIASARGILANTAADYASKTVVDRAELAELRKDRTPGTA